LELYSTAVKPLNRKYWSTQKQGEATKLETTEALNDAYHLQIGFTKITEDLENWLTECNEFDKVVDEQLSDDLKRDILTKNSAFSNQS
jgi:hypothetical protein